MREELAVLEEESQKLKETTRKLRREKQEAEEVADRCEEKVRAMVKDRYRIQDDKEEA